MKEIPSAVVLYWQEYRINELEARCKRLRELIEKELLPRYIELFEAAGLGDAKDSVAVQLARNILEL